LGSDFNVVLDGGRLVAKGSHQELVDGCEVYRALLAESLKRPSADRSA
jgi:ABC-type multidrug transport system fused ATPase/permease subunit